MVSAEKFVSKCRVPLEEQWGYILNASGAIWTEKEQQKVEADPDGYSMTKKYGRKWIGKRVVDCSGLPYWALKQFGIRIPHGSNSQWDKSVTNKSRLINGVREDGKAVRKGAPVFRTNGTDRHHTGVHLGAGVCVESKGTQEGVVTSMLSSWDETAEYIDVDYDEKEEQADMSLAKVYSEDGGSVKLRNTPSDKEKLYWKIPAGTTVTVMEKADIWSHVIAEGHIGYMMTEFLKFDDEPVTEPVSGDKVVITLAAADARELLLRLDKVTEQLVQQIGRG